MTSVSVASARAAYVSQPLTQQMAAAEAQALPCHVLRLVALTAWSRQGYSSPRTLLARRMCDGACILCSRPLEVSHNVCAECRLLVRNLLGVELPENWRDHPDGLHVVSDQGRIARLLNIDRSHRYPRVSIAGQKVYQHAMVAEAWHGPRPGGASGATCRRRSRPPARRQPALRHARRQRRGRQEEPHQPKREHRMTIPKRHATERRRRRCATRRAHP